MREDEMYCWSCHKEGELAKSLRRTPLSITLKTTGPFIEWTCFSCGTYFVESHLKPGILVEGKYMDLKKKGNLPL